MCLNSQLGERVGIYLEIYMNCIQKNKIRKLKGANFKFHVGNAINFSLYLNGEHFQPENNLA